MKHHRRSFGRTVLASGAATIIAGVARAQSWPSRPIRLIVPFATGGGSDFIGRFMAQRLGQSLGQPVVVENKPGASGNIGANAVAKAVPDGYTMMVTVNTFTITPALYASLPYDPVKDFTVVSGAATGNLALVAHPASGVRDPNDLLAIAKSEIGRAHV